MTDPYILAKKTLTQHPRLDMFKMHSHDDYELFCFLSGSAKYYIEGTIYNLRSGDILIMKKAESHSLIIDKCIPYERIVINFTPDALIGGTSKDIINLIDNRPLGKHNKYSILIYEKYNFNLYLNKICESDDFEEKRLYLTLILNELCKEYPDQTEGIHTDDFKLVLNYINENLFKDLNLEDIAEKFYLSKSHLNRKFRQYTGTTIWSYITTKRLIHSRTLIRIGEKPTSVYLKCGFKDYGTFYKAYKQKYGISPRDDKD